MSNESSASETTPLRRPESQISEDVSETATTTSPNRGTINEAAHLKHAIATSFNNTTNSASTPAITPTTATSRAATVAVGHYNNNNIEVLLSSNSHNSNTRSLHMKMDRNKRILCRIGLDVLVLACVGLPILCFFIWGDSYKRGFFCDDESLMHPFKDSTVRNWMLYIIGLVIPVGVIIAVEVIRWRGNMENLNGSSTARCYEFMGYEIPDWLVECYKKIGIFGFGAAVSQLTTDIAKYSIGRLRPHFFAVCQPIMPDGSTCSNAENAGRYIVDFKCRGINSTQRMLKEVTLSFPSGHSSFTFFCMVYLALYLQSRMTWRGSKLLRHFLQFAFIMVAWYTALSRVSDYKHHWSDVLAGSLIGSLCAVIVAKYVSDLFQDEKSNVLPKTRYDVPPHEITRNGH